MSMKYIRDTYGVPAKRGMRVVLVEDDGRRRTGGTITGAKNAYLCVRLDGERRTRLYHPNHDIEYQK